MAFRICVRDLQSINNIPRARYYRRIKKARTKLSTNSKFVSKKAKFEQLEITEDCKE